MGIKKILCVASFIMIAGMRVGWATNTTDIYWGGDSPISNTFLIGDSTGTLFDNNAIVVVGYFTDGFDIEANLTNLQALYDNFVVLDTGIVGEGEQSYYDGFVTGDVTIDTDSEPGSLAVDQVIYYWVLAGVTTYSEGILDSITEMALVTDTAWQVGADPGAIPSGTVSGNTYNITSNNIDTILYGTDGGTGKGTGSNTILTAPVPEPAFYAAGLGIVALLIVQLRRRRAA